MVMTLFVHTTAMQDPALPLRLYLLSTQHVQQIVYFRVSGVLPARPTVMAG